MDSQNKARDGGGIEILLKVLNIHFNDIYVCGNGCNALVSMALYNSRQCY